MNKPQPQAGPEIEEYSTTATPKAYAGSVPVFCAHDAIVPLKDLRPNPKNPNQHPPEQIKLLASIIRATGWRAPITVSKRSGLVTKGHGRLMAAQLDDLTDAPVDYQDYASEAEELADLTADNRIAELATTDNKMLAEVFADIDTGEIPFMLSGYTEDDYGNIVTALSEALHTKEPSSDPDAADPGPGRAGETYEELGEAMGVDEAAFAETMNTWNGYVEAKNDPDFGMAMMTARSFSCKVPLPARISCLQRWMSAKAWSTMSSRSASLEG